MQHAIARQTTFGSFGPVADGGKGGFNRVAGPDALPVLGRKIIKCQQFIPILEQTARRFRVFRLKDLNKQIKRLVCIILGFRLPDGVQGLLGFGLRASKKVYDKLLQ